MPEPPPAKPTKQDYRTQRSVRNLERIAGVPDDLLGVSGPASSGSEQAAAPEAAPVTEDAPAPVVEPTLKTDPIATVKAAAKAKAKPKKAKGIELLPVAALTPAEFQNRTDIDNLDSRTNEAKMQRIMSDFSPDELTPIVAWRDPVDNTLKVLDGHHTLEAAKRGGVKEVNVRIFKGTRKPKRS